LKMEFSGMSGILLKCCLLEHAKGKTRKREWLGQRIIIYRIGRRFFFFFSFFCVFLLHSPNDSRRVLLLAYRLYMQHFYIFFFFTFLFFPTNACSSFIQWLCPPPPSYPTPTR
jgi:hypothetical protein